MYALVYNFLVYNFCPAFITQKTTTTTTTTKQQQKTWWKETTETCEKLSLLKVNLHTKTIEHLGNITLVRLATDSSEVITKQGKRM